MKKVLIVGDSILDVYRDCSFKKECPDAPGVPAGIQNSTEDRVGGAANVAANLLSLFPGVKIDLVGALDARLADRLLTEANRRRLTISHILNTDEILVKERVLVDGRLIVRVDNRRQIDDDIADSICRYVEFCLLEAHYDLIIISDYGGGSINRRCLDLLLRYRDILLIDTKESDLSRFGTIDQKSLLIKLNEQEWKSALQRYHSPEQFFSFMIVTRGRDGAVLYTHRMNDRGTVSCTRYFSVPGCTVEQVDPCGCGDTFMAGLASAMLAGSDLFDSVRFANCAAATVVSQPRTAVADRQSVVDLFGKEV